jgi:L-malate glycosyltransferase
MKIAYIVPKLANQGPVLVVKDLVDNLIDKVEMIHVYYFDEELKELEFPCPTFKIGFFQSLDFDKYDIIHSHMLRPDAYIWMNRKKITKAFCISTLHQDMYQNLSADFNKIVAFIFERLWLILLKKQDLVVTLTKTMLKHYSDDLKNTALTTVYNGRSFLETNFEIGNEDLSILTGLKGKYKIIGILALLTYRKGIHQLIKALPYLTDYYLIVIGTGKEKERLMRLSKKVGVSDRCIFFGYRLNAYRYLNYFDLFAMTSYSEGFPLGILEAGHFKLPVVCSDIPVFKELFTENEVSFFELDKTESLVSAVKNATNNSQKLSINIYNKVHEQYSINRMANDYLDLYNRNFKK